MVRPMAIDVQISKQFPTFVTETLGTPNCATADPEAFFPERGEDQWSIRAAKRICNACIYAAPCREWAIKNREIGIWGGTTEFDRKRIRRMRKAVRDSKMI